MKLFTLFNKTEVHLRPGKKVVPQESAALLFEALDLHKKTEEDAQNFTIQTEQECEVLREEAKQKGFEEGLASFTAHIALLEEEKTRIATEMRQKLPPLVIAAAKKILGKELTVNPEAFVDLIATALKATSQHRRIKIFVNKSDLEVIEKERPRLKAIFEHIETLNIIAREGIAEKSATIETEAGIVQVSLDSQLHALEKVFQQVLKES